MPRSRDQHRYVRTFTTRRVASFNLEEYETAKEAFDAAAGLEPTNKTYHTWMAKCKAELDGEAGHPSVTMALGRESDKRLGTALSPWL